MDAMSTTIKPTLVPSPNPNTVFSSRKFSITSPIFRRASSSSSSYSSRSRLVIVKCNSSEESGNLKDSLAGIVDERVQELLNREENRGLLDGLEKASKRVEMAKRELAEIEKQELEAKLMREYVNQLESRASEIAECQREILEAGEKVEEAKRSLALNVDGFEDGDAFVEKESKEIDKNEERLESIKAGFISALVGTLAVLPISFTQLKTGTSAAFGFVKGLSMLASGPPLELNTGSFFSHAFDGAVYVSENLLLFVFAAVGLEYCFKMRLLSPFPIKRSTSR
ncbi:uncharacterized protein LOC132174642 isoform X2 [Corylus avellana]|uniref:uncharacterized protein LOC132174642 isoform X2 n=1 Tax=Corylus avellana TaxID=13451 RepID=UPI00286AE672|nr:uncharacterized protein LOC132174642 isoform X2 [Corylus avellana]